MPIWANSTALIILLISPNPFCMRFGSDDGSERRGRKEEEFNNSVLRTFFPDPWHLKFGTGDGCHPLENAAAVGEQPRPPGGTLQLADPVVLLWATE